MERFKVTKNKYKFDRFIFIPYLALVIALILGIWYRSGFDLNKKFYLKCDSMYCENPFIDNKDCSEEWCRTVLIERGEYGQKPDNYFMALLNWWWIGFLFCFALNHFIYNREWDYNKYYGED